MSTSVCPIDGVKFDPAISYDGARYTGHPRKWCSEACRFKARYLRLKENGYYEDNKVTRLAQARERWAADRGVRERRRQRRAKAAS